MPKLAWYISFPEAAPLSHVEFRREENEEVPTTPDAVDGCILLSNVGLLFPPPAFPPPPSTRAGIFQPRSSSQISANFPHSAAQILNPEWSCTGPYRAVWKSRGSEDSADAKANSGDLQSAPESSRSIIFKERILCSSLAFFAALNYKKKHRDSSLRLNSTGYGYLGWFCKQSLNNCVQATPETPDSGAHLALLSTSFVFVLVGNVFDWGRIRMPSTSFALIEVFQTRVENHRFRVWVEGNVFLF